MDEMGNLILPNYVTGAFAKLLESHGLRKIRFHDLRHSCASLLLKQGVPMKQIQEWLGHSDISTTANIYAHLDSQSKQLSAETMERTLALPGSKIKAHDTIASQRAKEKAEPGTRIAVRLPSGERISTDRSGSGDPSSAWWRKRWDSTHGLKNSPPDCFSPACGRVALFSSPLLKPPLKNAPTCGWCIPYWRKRWDSNPRALADYLL